VTGPAGRFLLREKGFVVLYRFDGKEPRIGADTYVSALAIVVGDVVIGDNCYIGHGAVLRGDYGRIIVGNGTAIEEGVVVHAPPDESNQIGDKVTIGHGAVVHGRSIGDLAVIGMNATISVWSEIGEGAVVAEGSVVKLKQVIPPGVVAAGNPARVVRKVEERDEKLWGWGKRVYVDLAKKYLEEGLEQVK
jgi:carbonic anhydrase/acetyltransferase-like protein (isoleucine patch superfamily)